MIRPFLPIAAWAIFLAVAIAPVHAWLAQRLGNRPRLAAKLVTLVLLAV